MKKKGLLFLLICTMLVLVMALSACSLVSVNTARQANRVMATVTVDLVNKYGNDVKVLGDDWNYTVSAEITRRELVSTVNYAINYYTQLYSYYGMTYNYDLETLIESGLKTLKTQKYNMLCAMGELLVSSKTTGRFDALYCNTAEYQKIYGKTLVPEGLLTVAERYSAVATVNKQFTDQLDKYVTEREEDERDNEKSEANNLLTSHYNNGYFVDSVSVAHKVGGEYADGLYVGEVIDDGDDKTADLNYVKLYVKVKLVKSDADDAYVYVPLEEENLSTDKVEDGEALPKYLTAKTATVSFSGRVYAEVTEDNDSGYTTESVKSEPVPYTLITPRTAYKAKEEEKSSDTLGNLRYVSNGAWENEAGLTDEMKELRAEIFNPSPATYESTKVKDAYRQLRSTFVSNNIGFIETAPGEKDGPEAEINFKYYKGLKYYYDSQFATAVLSAIEFELGATVTSSDGVLGEYDLLVLKDKANYEYLTPEKQVKKFFDTLKTDGANGLSSVYYVPIDALCSVSYAIEPSDKAYAPLFTLDEEGNVVSYSTLVTKESDGTYSMKYAYANADGTYTVNMIYVTHVLLSFDNVPGLADLYKQSSRDYSDEEKMIFIKHFVEQIKTCPQLTEYLEEYDADKEYKISDVFATTEVKDEGGNVIGEEMKYQTYAEVKAAMEEVITEAFMTGSFDELRTAFIKLTEMYNDDSGRLSGSGYVVSAGDMENGWYADFTATALNTYFGMLEAGVNPTGDDVIGMDGSEVIQEAYSDYGVHAMFITFTPLYHVTVDANGGLEVKTVIDLDGTTRWEDIGNSQIDALKSKKYTDWKAKMTDKEIDEHSSVNEKNYKRFIKDIKK